MSAFDAALCCPLAISCGAGYDQHVFKSMDHMQSFEPDCTNADCAAVVAQADECLHLTLHLAVQCKSSCDSLSYDGGQDEPSVASPTAPATVAVIMNSTAVQFNVTRTSNQTSNQTSKGVEHSREDHPSYDRASSTKPNAESSESSFISLPLTMLLSVMVITCALHL